MMRVFSFAFVSMFVCSTVVSGGGADGTPEIIGAARNGDLERVEALLEADPSVATVRGASGYTALHWAAIRDHESVALRLLKAGAPVDVIGADGGSPLHWACHHDRPDLVAAMLDAGADVGLVNRWGRTPLHTAARRGCIGVMALLLERGASVNAVTTKAGQRCTWPRRLDIRRLQRCFEQPVPTRSRTVKETVHPSCASCGRMPWTSRRRTWLRSSANTILVVPC
jgi:hypothetical protein